MIQISVKSTEVRNQRGTAKASGKPYDMNFQTVWAHTSDRNGNPNPYPEKVEVVLEKNDQGQALFYPLGEYTLSPSSIYVDRGGNLTISPKLVQLKPKAASAA
ncbi:MAG: single-stranded DNA-binding protein [Comamonas sp.]|uniref:single-stranded DNA-binding protein n=1 Tax=Comamonas sp. TaxID=34028 RepID=UPI002FC8181A